MKQKDVKGYVQFQLHRNVINLYKSFFSIIEDLTHEQVALIKKVKEKHEVDIGDLNFFTKDKYSHIRKKILDSGNDTLRDLDKNFELLDITLKSDKINLLKFTKTLKVEESPNGEKMTVKGKIL